MKNRKPLLLVLFAALAAPSVSSGGSNGLATTARMRLIAIVDSSAPGVPGATFLQFYPPLIGRDGRVIVAGKVTGGGATGSDNDLLWFEQSETTLTLVAREGAEPAGTPGMVISEPVDNFSPFLYMVQPPVPDTMGRVLINARLNGSVSGTWYGGASGESPVGYQNQPAPVYGDGRSYTRFDFATRMNRSGESILLGGLQSPQVGVLWQMRFADTLGVLDSTGMALPGYPAFWVSGQTTNPVVNDAGHHASIRDIYYGTFKYGPGIFTNRGGNDAALYTYLSDVPGLAAADSFRFFDWLRINGAGRVAFYAQTVQAPGVNGRAGLWAETAGGLELVTVLNVEAPGTPAGVTFLSFTAGGNSPDDVYYTDNDEVIFWARLTGTGVDASNDAGVWRKRAGMLELLAREGDEVPGADSGVAFDTIERLLVNARGDVVLFGTIKGPGITTANNLGFWGMDSLGNFRSAVRKGDKLALGSGTLRTFNQFFPGSANLGLPSTGADGKPIIFNERRELAFQARFLDSGIVRDAIVVADLNAFLPALLRLERPAGGEFWRAGESEDIEWSHDLAGGSVNLWYSSDFDTATRTGSFDTIVVNYPVDSGRYKWNIPDTIVSKRCVVMIEDASQPTVTDTSGLLKIKGYVLTRDSAGQWQAFEVTQDGWVFGNTEANMFPAPWWNQFDYKTGYDPFIPMPTPYPQDTTKPFHKAQRYFFPDWPSFVRAFGLGNCYLFLGPTVAVYRPSALALWSSITGAWGGSCFGFSISSLLAFGDSAAYRARYTTMPDYQRLHSVPIDPAVRNIINELFVHQFGTPHNGFSLTAYVTKTPSAFVQDVKIALGADTSELRPIGFYSNDKNNPGGHSVVPYRAVRDTSIPGYWIYVYDNNYPDDKDVKFEVDTAANGGLGSWENVLYAGWGGSRRLALDDPAGSYLTTPGIPAGLPWMRPVPRPIEPGTRPVAAASGITLFPSGGSSVLVTSDDGDSLGFADSAMIEAFPGASPMIAKTGFPSAPFAYRLPFEPIDIRLDDFSDSTATLALFADSVTYLYDRTGALPSQTDHFRFDGAFAYSPGDTAARSMSLQSVLKVDDSNERVFAIRNCVVTGTDTIGMQVVGAETLSVRNTGGATSYDLLVEAASPAGNPRSRHDGVPLAAMSTHLVVPAWADLGQPIRIFIDNGNDGSIDDTLDVVTGVEEEESGRGMPTVFALSQNYPNPFNASTVIRYEIPVRSAVTLSVYDVYGRLVASLVQETQEPGYRSVTWNAVNVASGTYFYRLTAVGVADPGTTFIRTGRMALVK